MKLKFEFTEEMRLKAFYALHLKRRLDPDTYTSESFDDWCNEMARIGFGLYLDSMIEMLNCVIERRTNDGKTNDETSEG